MFFKSHKVKIIKKHHMPSGEATALKSALERRGVRVLFEFFDGHKHIDLAIPRARINIEVDGIHHLTNPYQILADLNRGYYSTQKGYSTMHIPNQMIRMHLEEIADALAEASRLRFSEKIHIHVH